jgi:hypothetical protein
MSHVTLATIRHLLLDQVIPLCLNLRGREALHASAVLTPKGMCGFLGDTGSGKSTLAARFVAGGSALVSDDCLPLQEESGRIVAVPSYSGLRLTGDVVNDLSLGAHCTPPVDTVETSKRRVTLGAFQPALRATPSALFLLEQPSSNEAIVVERLAAADSMIALLRHAFRLDVTDGTLLTRQFRFFGQLALQTPVYRLAYPRRHSLFATVQHAILEHVAG